MFVMVTQAFMATQPFFCVFLLKGVKISAWPVGVVAAVDNP